MSSHGQKETESLKNNIQDQLSRLLMQLQCVPTGRLARGRRDASTENKAPAQRRRARPRTPTSPPSPLPPPSPSARRDLEELRHELEDEEYEETRKDTLEQMEEFDVQLRKLMEGDMTLVSDLGQVKLALRAAISNAFQTPDVIRSFARREPAALRERLKQLSQDARLGRVAEASYKAMAVEVVVALQRLGEELSADERGILDGASADVRKRFEAAEAGLSESAVLAMAAKAGGGGGKR
jgi:hypothetical protein